MKIDPNKEYSRDEIVKLGVLGKSAHTVVAAIWHDKYSKNILKTTVTGNGKGVRYKIKGINLLAYLKTKV